jgi:hypothetical protein
MSREELAAAREESEKLRNPPERQLRLSTTHGHPNGLASLP